MKFRTIALAVAITIATTVGAQPNAPMKAVPQINPQQIKPINPGVLQTLNKPDLAVMSITLRPLGGVPYAYVCVQNLRSVATGPFDVEVTMQQAAPSGSPPISWAMLVGKIRYPAFSATTSYTCNDFRLPGNSVPNCVKVIARADVGNEVAEMNEANNSREQLSACLGEPPRGASLPRLRDLPGEPIIKPPVPPIPPRP
ncbi:MAG: hypothetical protein ACRCWJ_20430 [Casimicrobium sp.]